MGIPYSLLESVGNQAEAVQTSLRVFYFVLGFDALEAVQRVVSGDKVLQILET